MTGRRRHERAGGRTNTLYMHMYMYPDPPTVQREALAELFSNIPRERRGLDDDVPGATEDDDPNADSAGILDDEDDDDLDFSTNEGLAARDEEYARTHPNALGALGVQSAAESPGLLH